MSLHAVESEFAIIGSLLLDPETAYHCATLQGQHFFDQSARKYYNAIMTLLELNHPVGPDTLYVELGSQPWALDYYNKATGSVATAKHIEYHISQVMDAYARRRVVGACAVLSERARDGVDVADLDAELEKVIGAPADGKGGPLSASEVLNRTWSQLETPDDSGHIVATGIDKVDLYIGGVKKGLVTVIGARPSMGKTALLCNMVLNMARMGNRCLVMSLEDMATGLMGRVLSRLARVDSQTIAQSRCDKSELSRILNAIPDVPANHIWIDDGPRHTVSTIRGAAVRQTGRDGLDVLFVDHLGVLTADADEYASVSANMRGVCDIAKELGCAVVLLHQLNRKLSDRQDRRPMLSDLRGSGKVEEYARAVWFLHREGYYDPEANQSELELIVAKNTHGRTGTIKLDIDLQYMSIGDPVEYGPGMERYEY